MDCFKLSAVWLRWIMKTLVSVTGLFSEIRNHYINRSPSNFTVKYKLKGTGINLSWAIVRMVMSKHLRGKTEDTRETHH
jgi:uncharacterized membrane protein